MSECLKYDELTKRPCQMQPNFDDFGHFLKVKVAEMFWGAQAPQAPCRCRPTLQKHYMSKGLERLSDITVYSSQNIQSNGNKVIKDTVQD